jgi:hypothetical protein
VDKVFASGRIFGLIWQNILKISWQHWPRFLLNLILLERSWEKDAG